MVVTLSLLQICLISENPLIWNLSNNWECYEKKYINKYTFSNNIFQISVINNLSQTLHQYFKEMYRHFTINEAYHCVCTSHLHGKKTQLNDCMTTGWWCTRHVATADATQGSQEEWANYIEIDWFVSFKKVGPTLLHCDDNRLCTNTRLNLHCILHTFIKCLWGHLHLISH